MDYSNGILVTGFCSSCYLIWAACIVGWLKGEKYSTLTIVLLGVGAVAGIIVAEYIRRNIGLDSFFARIYGPNELDENKKDK